MPYRLMYRFWLDVEKGDEEAIADQIETLKNERSFTSAIRDGIRLVFDLRQGKMDVLFELFPWVRAEFLEHFRAMQDASADSSDPGQERMQLEAERLWLEAETERMEAERRWHEQRLEEERRALEAERNQQNTAIQRQLERLEQLLIEQGNQPIERTEDPAGLSIVQPQTIAMQPIAGAPTRLNVPKIDLPVYDDDDLELTVSVDTSTGARAADNFLNSLFALQGASR